MMMMFDDYDPASQRSFAQSVGRSAGRPMIGSFSQWLLCTFERIIKQRKNAQPINQVLKGARYSGNTALLSTIHPKLFRA